jgi:hypothetical protein
MRFMTTIAIAMLGGSIVGGVAQAQAPAPSCREQIRSACGQVQPGNGAMRSCVSAHLNELTPDCQQKIAAHQARFQAHKAEVAAVKASCSADLAKSCADVVPGGGRELMCLKAHEPTVSASCAQALSELPQRHFAARGHGGRGHFGACKAEKQSFCADVKPGEGRVVACLQAHQAQLGPACTQALSWMAERAGGSGEQLPPAPPQGR